MSTNGLNSYLFKSISYNILLQIGFRLTSFILNSFLIHYVHTEFIGACNFRLTLLYTTIIFLSREPFRRALPSFNELNLKLITSLWLIVLNGLIITIIFGSLWYFIFDEPNKLLVPNYRQSIVICCIACLIELCGEPANCLNQIKLNVKHKFYIESISLLSFNLTFVLLVFYLPSLGALSYSYARLVYSILYLILNNYLINDNILPKTLNIDWSYIKLVKAYYFQSIFKQLLTEGEKYLITIFNLLSFSESGIYDIINNLGSLIARFLYLPIEDASYIYFINTFKRGQSLEEQIKINNNKEKLIESKELYENMLKLLSIFGIIISIYGQSYSKLLLYIYGGTNLSSNEITLNMLRIYCIYVYFLGINGLSECFLNATMSDKQLNKHNYRLILFSSIYLAFIFISIKYIHQVYGLLIANCLNMTIRSIYSLIYANKLFNGSFNIKCLILPESFILNCVFFMCILLTKLSELFISNQLIHLTIGFLIFTFNLFIIYKYENKFLFYLIKFIKEKSQ
jgi:oligosaccharide translocation protein RFT1